MKETILKNIIKLRKSLGLSKSDFAEKNRIMVVLNMVKQK